MHFDSGFEIALDRIRAIITIAISVERLQAIFSPGNYFFMDHKKVCHLSSRFELFLREPKHNWREHVSMLKMYIFCMRLKILNKTKLETLFKFIK